MNSTVEGQRPSGRSGHRWIVRTPGTPTGTAWRVRGAGRVGPLGVAAPLLLLLLAAGCRSAPSAPPGPRLFTSFGTYTRAVTTDSAEAQRWFDQGIQLLYGFNHDEAIRSFREATRHDPRCAMAWWGVAYANGLHINNPEMTELQSQRGYEAAQEALRHLDRASAVERMLIRAVAQRYAWPAPEDRRPLDEAYAAAMEETWRRFPQDPDVGALFAESLMNLQPWDLWEKDGRPKGRTPEIVAVLEQVIGSHPGHPGANHFYIHAVEASPAPERAIASADRLGSLVPGSGHLVHMPAHIYARIGRWEDASDANERAIAVDRAYFAVAPPPEFYGLYFVHNIHFLAWSAMMEGRFAVALNAARELERDIPPAFLAEYPQFADGFLPVTYHVLIRFGRWEDILREPEAPEFRRISRTMRHYARGVAFSALGRTDEARAEQARFEEEAALIPEGWMVGNNPAPAVIAVARRMLGGELAWREGRVDEAFALLREGAALEDDLAYDEPPGWMQPVRHALGALLMSARRYADAEAVYGQDLEINRNNGWAMLGLENAARAQGRNADAARYAGERRRAWRRADVQPTSSCYCEP